VLRGLLREAWQEYERDFARYFAVAMVYYALISLVPLLLLLLGGLGLLLRLSDFAAGAAAQLLQGVETAFGAPVRDTVEQLFERLKEESVFATIISLVGLLLTGSKLFHHLRMTFRAIWKYESPLVSGPMLKVIWATLLEKATAFVMMLAGGGLLLLALVLIAALHWVGARMSRLPWLSEPTALVLALIGPVVIAPLTFGLIFRYLPPTRLEWRHVWLASVLCAVAWLVGAEALALYGAFFGTSHGAYGALGGVLIIMLWMNLVSQMIFLGAELCKVVVQNERRQAIASQCSESEAR